MTTFKIIDHDCNKDPVGLAPKECKVDAPTSAHALAEYMSMSLEEILATLPDFDPETDTELWRVTRSWDGHIDREVGAIAYERD